MVSTRKNLVETQVNSLQKETERQAAASSTVKARKIGSLEKEFSISLEENTQLTVETVAYKEEIYRLRREVAARDIEINHLSEEINQLYRSKSWRITKPFRMARDAMRFITDAIPLCWRDSSRFKNALVFRGRIIRNKLHYLLAQFRWWNRHRQLVSELAADPVKVQSDIYRQGAMISVLSALTQKTNDSIESASLPIEQKRARRLIAIYLPQYHPIPENDQWWGKGFTEWTNVAKARPLFDGHYQPHLPADMGFYDLRVPEVRQVQADLAREYGIYGFCYYHYWFGGRRLLERPFQEVLESGQPDFPFCLCWANENWSRNWDGGNKKILMPQDYSPADDRRHIEWLLRAFSDPRYIRIDGLPLMSIYRANDLPDIRQTIDIWREAAAKHGFPGLYLCRMESLNHEREDPTIYGFDAAIEFQPDWLQLGQPMSIPIENRGWLRRKLAGRPVQKAPSVYEYNSVVKQMLAKPDVPYRRFPSVTPSWDNTPRQGRNGLVLWNSTPEGYEYWLTEVLLRPVTGSADENLVFINAWNEWAEGNHIEPDARFGRGYLEATRHALQVTGTAFCPSHPASDNKEFASKMVKVA